MANIKKVRSQRKKVVSHSVKTAIAEEFRDICNLKGLVPSHIVEKMMVDYISNNPIT